MIRKTVEGREFESQMIGELNFDQTPKEGSFNPVTSDGVAKSIGEANEAIKNIELRIWKEAKIESDTLRFVFEKTDFDPNVLNISNIKWTKKDSDLLNVWEAKYLNNAATLLSGKFRYTGNPSINNFNQTGWVDVVAGNVSKGFYMGLATNESLRSIEIREGSFGNTLYSAFSGCSHLKSLILPTSGIEATIISRIADACYELEYVNNFDASEATDATAAFNNCNNLKSVPLLDTGKMTNVSSMLNNCNKVEEGALALYTIMSSQTTPPSSHSDTFYNCGKDTSTGLAELNQIPKDWGGNYDPLNPLNLPPKTIRCKFTSGYTPIMGTSQTLVDADENVWDIGFSSAESLFYNRPSLLEVLGANTSGVTNMENMFDTCSNLRSVQIFDTSSVTNMYSMFNHCTSLTTVPLFNTSSVTNTNSMFRGCTSLTAVPLFNTSKVTVATAMFESCTSLTAIPLFDTSKVSNMIQMFKSCTSVTEGALALYQQASTQATPPSSHTDTFKDCGANTVTGAAELAQIPASWGGTAT